MAFSYENGKLAAYINCSIEGTKDSISQTVNRTITPLRLGISSSNGGEVFAGLLDEVCNSTIAHSVTKRASR